MPAAERRVIFAIPGDIDTRSGGYGYDRQVIGELRALGWTVEHLALPAGFPAPSSADLATTAQQFAALTDGSLVLVDGLAFGAMPGVAAEETQRLRLVALVHHPLALETGLSAETTEKLKASETKALKTVRGVIVTSPATARTLLADFDVGPDAILIAVPGTRKPAQAKDIHPGRGHDGLSILSVASLTPRKDHALLVSALGTLADRDWHCRIVGSDSMNPDTARALRHQIAEAGLDHRIALAGTVNNIDVEYARADIFALASRYEGYGMAFAEAMTWGLPIVGCRGGAVADVVPPSAGLLVEPGDAEGFAAALARLIGDPGARRNYAFGSLIAGRQLPDWRATGTLISEFLERIR